MGIGYPVMATVPKANFRILVNSTMWQSHTWSAAVTNVLSADEMRKDVESWSQSLAIAWRMFRRRRSFDVVATMGPRVALAYGLLCRCIGHANPPHVVREVFFHQVCGRTWMWRMKRSLFTFGLRDVAACVVNSNEERRLYASCLNIGLERFHFIPFHTNILDPHFEPGARYGLAAGKSHRDYRTFLDAIRDLAYPFVVISDRGSVAGLKIPDNTSVYCDIPREKYLSLLRDAAFAVIPLYDVPRSTGQVVILEAYAFGKPVVATRTVGTIDYVEDGRTGYLCSPGAPDELQDRVRGIIVDSGKREEMGRAGLARVLGMHTFEAHVAATLELIYRAAEGRRCGQRGKNQSS